MLIFLFLVACPPFFSQVTFCFLYNQQWLKIKNEAKFFTWLHHNENTASPFPVCGCVGGRGFRRWPGGMNGWVQPTFTHTCFIAAVSECSLFCAWAAHCAGMIAYHYGFIICRECKGVLCFISREINWYWDNIYSVRRWGCCFPFHCCCFSLILFFMLSDLFNSVRTQILNTQSPSYIFGLNLLMYFYVMWCN